MHVSFEENSKRNKVINWNDFSTLNFNHNLLQWNEMNGVLRHFVHIG